MTINELCIESHNTAKEKGWWDDPERNFPEQLMLMVSELSEVLEEYRKYGLEKLYMIYNKANFTGNHILNKKPEGIAVEFADLLIRIADICAKYEIPLEEALKAKMEYNKTRPYRHGNKKC